MTQGDAVDEAERTEEDKDNKEVDDERILLQW